MSIEPWPWWLRILILATEFAAIVLIGLVLALAVIGIFYLLAWVAVNW